MRVLLINFEMDRASPVLAWQARVATALAAQCESVHVLTEKVGSYDAAPNMTVDVMPRWPFGIPKRFGGGVLVNWQLHRMLKKYPCDVCFIHMAHTWAYRLWPALRLHGLPVLLWYAHGSVSWHLRLATACVEKIITSTAEGFRINSPKKTVIGQAIDTNIFDVPTNRTVRPEIVYVGRISERKRIILLIDVLNALRQITPEIPWSLKLVGPSLTSADAAYLVSVRKHIAALHLEGCVQIMGSMTSAGTAELYKTAAVHLNVSETGSMDKTVMEALACGCPVVTTNPAFYEALSSIPGMYSISSDPITLAEAILSVTRNPPQEADLRQLVSGKHDLNGWIAKIKAMLLDLQRGKAGM
ncbi:MAG: glycosyltransferase family 4 protein [Pseudomonadota bacterium]